MAPPAQQSSALGLHQGGGEQQKSSPALAEICQEPSSEAPCPPVTPSLAPWGSPGVLLVAGPSQSHRTSSCSCLGDPDDKINFVNGGGGVCEERKQKKRKKRRLRTGTAGIQLPCGNQLKINIRYAERGCEPTATWKKSDAGRKYVSFIITGFRPDLAWLPVANVSVADV